MNISGWRSKILLLILLTACSDRVRGNTIAVSFGSYDTTAESADVTFAWSFTLKKAITLTDLGLWDAHNQDPFQPTGDGFASLHTVSLWSGSGTLLTSATLAAGKSGTLIDGFRYVSVAPLLLQPGDYVIGAYFGIPPGGDWSAAELNDFSFASPLVYTGQFESIGPGFPNEDLSGLPRGYFGPNFQFTTNSQRVAESGVTLTLLAVGITALLILRSAILTFRRSTLNA